MDAFDSTERPDARAHLDRARHDLDWREAADRALEADTEHLRIDGGQDVGYRDQPLETFRDQYPGEYLEPWSATSPIEPFAAPETTVHEVNPRYEEGVAYQVNCADSARAFERTWRGDREEAAGRAEHTGPFGPDGETSDRTEQWAAERFSPVASIDEVRDRIEAAGHGSSAIVHAQGTNRDGFHVGHAFNVVNDCGEVKVVDAQEGRVQPWRPATGHPGFASITSSQVMGWDATRRSLW
jgi:hypothetical protein